MDLKFNFLEDMDVIENVITMCSYYYIFLNNLLTVKNKIKYNKYYLFTQNVFVLY